MNVCVIFVYMNEAQTFEIETGKGMKYVKSDNYFSVVRLIKRNKVNA